MIGRRQWSVTAHSYNSLRDFKLKWGCLSKKYTQKYTRYLHTANSQENKAESAAGNLL